ncbi:secreted protein [methanotrophic bacterial endosymbiont of Bathymodiolus sp.]|nr:secreted protein [methanotrophic bacterial endosymbiont of Bathymodiolus sp.]
MGNSRSYNNTGRPMKKLLIATLVLASLTTAHVSNASPLGDEIRAELTAERLKSEDFMRMSSPVEDDMSANGWITDQPTFNYKMPCASNKIKAVAIIVKDLNVMERVEINADGQYLATNDTSKVFPEFEQFCVAIVMPKSGVSTVIDDKKGNRYYRTYWMSQGADVYRRMHSPGIVFVQERNEELAAYMDVIYTANTALHKPVFIFNGHVNKHVAIDILKTLGGTSNGGMAPFIDKITPHTQKDVLSAIVGEDVNYNAAEGWIQGENFSVSGWSSKDVDPDTITEIGASD